MLELKSANSHETDEVGTAASVGHFLKCTIVISVKGYGSVT